MKRKGARLGQHFLTGAWAARRLVEAAAIQTDDTVLEIGPGTGALTRELLATGAHIVAVEKDQALVANLQEQFAAEITSGHLELVADDIRNFKPSSSKLEARSYVLAANIPYYITGEIIRKFLTEKNQPHTIALLVQKEVADRIVARGGKESILSLSVKVYGTPKIVAKVSRGNFSPPPSVDSAILVVERISRRFFLDVSEQHFFSVVKRGFSSKRKKLLKNLASSFELQAARNAFAACTISEDVRAEDVSLLEWKCIARDLEAGSS